LISEDDDWMDGCVLLDLICDARCKTDSEGGKPQSSIGKGTYVCSAVDNEMWALSANRGCLCVGNNPHSSTGRRSVRLHGVSWCPVLSQWAKANADQFLLTLFSSFLLILFQTRLAMYARATDAAKKVPKLSTFRSRDS